MLGLSARRPAFVKLLPFWRPDQDANVAHAVRRSKPFSTSSTDVRSALGHAAAYITRRKIEGSIFVADTEHGGSAVALAEMLQRLGASTGPGLAKIRKRIRHSEPA